MPPSYVEEQNLVRVFNDDGEWVVRKRHEADGSPAGPGPGYIFSLIRPDGRILALDSWEPDGTINDPRYGGLGCVGMHVARQNGQPDPVNYTWDVTGRHRAATRGGYGVGDGRLLALGAHADHVYLRMLVPFYDGEAWQAGLPLAEVDYSWLFFASRAEGRIAIRTLRGAQIGSPAFVKEPKIVCHSLGSSLPGSARFEWLDLFRRDGSLIKGWDLTTLANPSKGTRQLPFDERVRARFRDVAHSNSYLNVVAEALRPDDGREKWEGSAFGLDRWAQISNGRAKLEPCESDERYCLQGPGSTLTRQWEVARWRDPARPQTGVMLHSWEGGSGYHDCRCCFRRFGPEGETFRAFICLSFNAGWVV